MMRRMALAITAGACTTLVIVAVISRFGEETPARTPLTSEIDVRLQAQVGHGQLVRSVEFSSDGRQLRTGAPDGVRLWSTDSGRLISAAPEGAFLSVDGRPVTRQGTLTDASAAKFFARSNNIAPWRANGFSPDGRWLAEYDDESITLWDTAHGRRTAPTIEADNRDSLRHIQDLAFSPDGERLAIAGINSLISLVDTATGAIVKTLKGHQSSVYALAFTNDSRFLLSTGADDKARLWDAVLGTEVRQFSVTSWNFSVAVSRTNQFVAVGGGDHRTRVFELSTGRLLKTLEPCGSGYSYVSFSPVEDLLAIACNTSITLWRTPTFQEVRRFRGVAQGVTSTAITPDGRRLAVGTQFGDVRVWNLDAGTASPVRNDHTDGPFASGITAMAFIQDGRVLVSAGDDGKMVSADLDSEAILKTFIGHTDAISSLAMSTDGSRLLTGGTDKIAYLWDSRTGQQVRQFSGFKGLVTAVALSSDGTHVFTGTSDSEVQMWDASDGAEIRKFTGHSREDLVEFGMQSPSVANFERRYDRRRGEITAMSMSPDGRSLVTAGGDGYIVQWDIATGNEVRRTRQSQVKAVTFSADGTSAICGLESGAIWTWNTATGASEGTPLLPHFGSVTSVLLTRGRDLLVTSGLDGMVKIWSASSHVLRATIANVDTDGWMVIDPEGRFDVSGFDGPAPFNWVASDNPTEPLSPAIFQRQYFEPRLLARTLEHEKFQPVPPLATLNRLQPFVTIEKVEWENVAEARARITVRVGRAAPQSSTAPREDGLIADVHDLKLFRDGQLIASVPDEASLSPDTGSPQRSLDEWRRASRVRLDNSGSARKTFVVQAPRQKGRNVAFSAYAFNQDRVKSETATSVVIVPDETRERRGRAYVIAAGVNRTVNGPGWDLLYAANDARAVAETLGASLKNTGEFADVIVIRLISDQEPLRNGEAPATKENFELVLDRLAGRSVAPDRLSSFPELRRVERAEPEDLVVFAVSSHGYTDGGGRFRFVLAGQGSRESSTGGVHHLRGTLSTDDLAKGLQHVDSGQLILIVDACQSEATVAADGFKPGPMGSRGLGQLAYDKGMRVLAASRSQDVAIERGGPIKQGLLSYALIREGLESRQADFKPPDGTIGVGEWLAYAVQAVPRLFLEGEATRSVAASGEPAGTRHGFLGAGRTAPRYQQPVLFDFARRDANVLIAR